jgi:hypothetical protein
MLETLNSPGSGEGEVEDKTIGILAYITLIGFIVARF